MLKHNVLVLHRVVDDQVENFIDITLQTLQHILGRSKGRLTTIDEALAKRKGTKSLICLTFDDGFSSDYEIVLPELKKLGSNATFFVVTDWLGSPGYLTVKQVKCLSDSGMQIGSHSKSHPSFLTITRDERLVELIDSKLMLENIIGKEVSTFSFPYGFFNDECAKMVFEAGYKVCCNSMHGLFSSRNSIVRRNSINAQMSLKRIDKILNAKFVQRTTWFLEDCVKILMKRYLPGPYIWMRNFLSSF